MAFLSFLTASSYSFEGKKSYENVLVFLCRHWFVIFIQIVAFVILGALPIAGYFLIAPYLRDTWVSLLQLFVVAFFMIWWCGLFYRITMYLLDYWIVTDHRIIDSEQHGFFNRTVAELNLAKIQDISVQIIGLIPTWLNYGNLEVQTAGASEKFFFKEIPRPQKVKDIIMEAHNNYIKIHKDEVEIHE